MRWLNDYGRQFLSKGYLAKDETVEERVRFIADHAEKLLGKTGFADRFYDYMERGYFSLSSPVWANFGRTKGLPISCFGSFIPDNMQGILYTQAEVGMMSKYGGGSSGYFGALRPRGSIITDNGTSSGSVHFMKLFDSMVNVVNQGSVRRGQFSPYLPIDHGDIMEFLDIGTEGNPIQMLTHGVTVSDEWMAEMINGDEAKREVWAKLIQRRRELGYPYILYTDNANNGKPQVYKDKGLEIVASNLCSEIMLPSKEDWSFVCNLSSMNVLHYDEWKDTDAVETLTYFLDAVMTEFITRLESWRDADTNDKTTSFRFFKRAYNFAKANRALGLGVLGWHSYLQSKMIPFESDEATNLNKEIFSNIESKAYAASEQLAKEYGEPEIMVGTGRRNATLMAVAPTTSSAFILGQVSQSIEPIWSNAYVKDIERIKVTIYNPVLKKLLASKDKDTNEIWDSIKYNDGSVQHLDCLTQEEKDVFRTFAEIDQTAVIKQAADRQKFIDQGQSLNLMVMPDVSPKDINNLYLMAWRLGIKSLYYQHSMNAAQQLSRKKIVECASCEA